MVKVASGALRSAALGKESGLHQHIQSLALYPRSDYLRGLNSIAHANFITTTLAPMGEHRFKRRVKAMSGPIDGKRETEPKGPGQVHLSERKPLVLLRNVYSAPNRKMESFTRRFWRIWELSADRRTCHRGWKWFKINSRTGIYGVTRAYMRNAQMWREQYWY